MKTLKISLMALMVSLLTSANVNAQNVVHSMKAIDNTLLKMSIVYSQNSDSTDFSVSKIYFDGANVGDDGFLTLTTIGQGVVVTQRIKPSRSNFDAGSQTRVAVFDLTKVKDVNPETPYLDIIEVSYELASGLDIDVTADVKQIVDANK
jgi:hypothetical protein